MPDFMFTLEVEDITTQRATALRAKLEAFVSNEDLVLAQSSQAQTTATYRVRGVVIDSREAFDERVEATDADAAAELAGDPDRVVVSVTETV